MISLDRTYMLMLAVLVAAFVALYPYLNSMGFCGFIGCPEMFHSSHVAHGGSVATCLVAVLVAAPTALAFAALYGRRATRCLRPADPYLAPDSPPPRPYL